MSYTPGPWHAEQECDQDGNPTENWWIIMGSQPCAYDFDRKEDAVLAAAAPELLEALEEATAWIRAENYSAGLLYELDEVIAKAKGKQE